MMPAELIRRLQELPEGAELYIGGDHCHCGYLSWFDSAGELRGDIWDGHDED